MAIERLQKVLAAAGVGSRRACETIIAAGRVTVDGRLARLGDQVDPATARIEVDGRLIGGASAPIHLALNKPAGVTATVRDRHADRTVLELLPTAMVPDGARLYPVGRLDRDSEGLLLLTNDGEWAERVLHPRFGIEREYAVGLPVWLSNDQRAVLDEGTDLEEGRAAFAHPIRPASSVETARLLAVLGPPPADGLAWYRVVLRQGWKRQVRRMFATVGAPITRLVRVRIGAVRLDDLPSGRFRRLRHTETKALGAGKVEAPLAPAAPARPATPAPGSAPPRRRAADLRPAGVDLGGSGQPPAPRRPAPWHVRPERPTAGGKVPRGAGPATPEGEDRPRRAEQPDRPVRPFRPDRPTGSGRPKRPPPSGPR